MDLLAGSDLVDREEPGYTASDVAAAGYDLECEAIDNVQSRLDVLFETDEANQVDAEF
jgi:hypothetical protein